MFLGLWNVVLLILVVILEVIVVFFGDIEFEEVEFSCEIIDLEISSEVGISDILGLWFLFKIFDFDFYFVDICLRFLWIFL